jgi:hypothetical protein
VTARTVWNIVGPSTRPGVASVELTVATQDEAVLEQIEKAAANAGIVLERIPNEEDE